MFRRALLPLLLLLVPIAATAGTQWMHLRVVETGGDGTRVSVNVPLSLVEMVAALVPDHECRNHRMKLQVDGNEVTGRELRGAWRAVRGGADDRAVNVGDGRDELRVWKNKGRMVMRSTGRHDAATVMMPANVADALLRGNGDELDLAGAVRALAVAGEGELVIVGDDDTYVRMWVDGAPEGGRR